MQLCVIEAHSSIGKVNGVLIHFEEYFMEYLHYQLIDQILKVKEIRQVS